MLVGLGWRRRLQDWLIQRASSQTRINASPMGQ